MARREGFDDSLRSLSRIRTLRGSDESRRLAGSLLMARREGFEPPTLRFEDRFEGKK